MGRQIRVAAVLLLGLLLLSSGVTWAVGPMIFSGDDADSTGHCQGTACGSLYAKALNAVYNASNPAGNNILAIMTNTSSTARNALTGWLSLANFPGGVTITYVTSTGATSIPNVIFSNYRMIYVPSGSNNTSGGITQPQLNALNLRKTDIQNFVKAGGGVLALTEQGLTSAFGWLPVALTPVAISDTNVNPTLDMYSELPATSGTGGVTDANMDHNQYHNSWTGTFGDLKILAVTNRLVNGNPLPVIVGRITPVNRPPTDIALDNSSAAENQPIGTAVGNLSTTDPDAANTFTYTLVSGTGSTDNASFSITGSSLKTAAIFDFETKSSYSVRIRSTDQGTLSTEKVFTITVTNVNEAPTNIALSASSVDENKPIGTTVGSFSTADPDVGDTFTYTLATGGTDNASFSISGAALKTAAVFNYEVKKSYSILVRSTDVGGLSFDKQFTINVNNVPEAVAFETTPLNLPFGVAVDATGNVYVADRNSHKIRKFNSSGTEQAPVAGTGDAGYNGDSPTVLATAAQLNGPTGVALDGSGNLFIADTENNLIRKVVLSTGNISTVAGVTTGVPLNYGDAVNGGLATLAKLRGPRAVAVDGSGNLYIADTMNQQVRKVDGTGTISAVAGTGDGTTGYVDGPVASSKLNSPQGVAVNSLGTVVFIADEGNDNVRRVLGGSVDHILMPGSVQAPSGVALAANGTLFIADTDNNRILRVSLDLTTVDIVAGTANELNSPMGVAVSADGCFLYVADLGNQRIQKVDLLCGP